MIFGKKSNDLKGEKSISGGGAVSDRQLKDIVKKYIGYVKAHHQMYIVLQMS